MWQNVNERGEIMENNETLTEFNVNMAERFSEQDDESEQDTMEREQTLLDKKRSLRPIMKDQHHQDSLFGNSFQAKSFFVVHPEWLSEAIDNTGPEPLHRPPWPWEQPRYRQNIQIPITYTPVECEKDKIKTKPEEVYCPEQPRSFAEPIGLPIGYTFTQPGIDLTRPYEKQTQFGAPLVNTSVYKLGH